MKMFIPPGHTEETVLAAIEKAVSRLAPAFSFGYFTPEDIKQEGYVLACEVLSAEKYNPSLRLDNFLFIHIRNRLSNLKRRVMRRNDPPCKKCAAGEFCKPDGACKKYRQWLELNNSKSCLAGAGVESASEGGSSDSPHVEAEIQEAKEKIDVHLPVELREDYLRMLAGERLSNARRSEVLEAVKEIIGWDRSDD